MTFFKSIDMFGTKINLRYNTQPFINSTLGGVITLFTLFLVAGMLLGFGQDFFKRKNPTVIESTVSPANYPFWIINNKNYSYGFVMEDINAAQPRDYTQFYYIVAYNRYKKNQNKEWEIAEYYHLPWKNCTKDDFSDEEQFYTRGFGIFLCPKFDNIEVGGFWDSEELAFVSIEVHRCLEGSKNPHTGENCSSNEKRIQTVNDRFFYSSIVQSVIANPSNYSNPLTYDYSNKYKTINENFLRRELIFNKETYINTDYGWIFKTHISTSKIGFEFIESDILNIESRTSTLQYDTRLYFDKKKRNIFREYVKIQKLAAEVGGILKLFMSLAYIITEYFNNFYLNYSLGKSFISNEEFNSFEKYFNSKYMLFNTKTFTMTQENVDIINDKNETQKVKAFSTKTEDYLCPTIKREVGNDDTKNKQKLKKNNYIYPSPSNDDNNKNLIKLKVNYNDFKIKNNQELSHSIGNASASNNLLQKSINNMKRDIYFNNTNNINNYYANDSLPNNNFIKTKNKPIENKQDIKLISEAIIRERNKSEYNYMSAQDFLCTSFPCVIRCKKSKEFKYRSSLVKTINGYLNSLISVETLIDSRFIINKLKDVLFDKDQLYLINHIPNREFDNFYNNTYKQDNDILNPNKAFNNKKFILSLRKHMSCKNMNQELEIINNVARTSFNNDINSRIIQAYKA